MNKLIKMSYLGLKVTWKVITIGLYGAEYISPQISKDDILEYLNKLLVFEDSEADDIILLICEDKNSPEFDKILNSLANNENSDFSLQLRKWRAYLLNELLNNLSQNCLQGLLELTEFWVSFGIPKDCPHVIQGYNNNLSSDEYYIQPMYNRLKKKNQKWLDNEISYLKANEN